MDNIESLEVFTTAEVARRLKVSTKTVYRYIDNNMFVNLVVIPGPERPRYRFTTTTINAFIKKYSGGIEPEQREKRAYHKKKVKGRRAKKK